MDFARFRVHAYAMANSREERAKSSLGEYLAQHRGRMSMRRAAALAGISEGRWRQVEAGYEVKSSQRFAVNPKPATVTAMARAVGADPGHALELAGFDPAGYDWLLAERSASSDSTREKIERAWPGFTDSEKAYLAGVIEGMESQKNGS